jgi:hypothetical protein
LVLTAARLRHVASTKWGSAATFSMDALLSRQSRRQQRKNRCTTTMLDITRTLAMYNARVDYLMRAISNTSTIQKKP